VLDLRKAVAACSWKKQLLLRADPPAVSDVAPRQCFAKPLSPTSEFFSESLLHHAIHSKRALKDFADFLKD
jgi:hypothetical protein